jgi:hypothetical protein
VKVVSANLMAIKMVLDFYHVLFLKVYLVRPLMIRTPSFRLRHYPPAFLSPKEDLSRFDF